MQHRIVRQQEISSRPSLKLKIDRIMAGVGPDGWPLLCVLPGSPLLHTVDLEFVSTSTW